MNFLFRIISNICFVYIQCCYFLRQEGSVDTSISSDATLLYGEVGGSPLQTMEAITSTFSSIFAKSCDWGKVDQEQKDDFSVEMNSLIGNLSGAVECMRGSFELMALEKNYSHGLGKNGNFFDLVDVDEETLEKFKDILERWLKQINDYLSMDRKSSEEDDGPRGEVDFWRARVQRFTSINEQMRRTDCRGVTGLLSSHIKLTRTNQPKSGIENLMERWKETDILVTEAVNEAKDNAKYLSTLQRFLDPLYHGSIPAIIDILPSLLNSVKVSVSNILSSADIVLSEAKMIYLTIHGNIR